MNRHPTDLSSWFVVFETQATLSQYYNVIQGSLGTPKITFSCNARVQTAVFGFFCQTTVVVNMSTTVQTLKQLTTHPISP